MRGDDLPAALLEYPGVGVARSLAERLHDSVFIGKFAFFHDDAGHDGGISHEGALS